MQNPEKMHLSMLGFDVLTTHLAPFLKVPTILALSLTDKHLHGIFASLRFRQQILRPRYQADFILDVFSPSTVSSITHMLFDSTTEDHARILSSQSLFTSLRSLCIAVPIPNPDFNFTALLERLTNFEAVKTFYSFGSTPRSMLTAIRPGTLCSLVSLTLEHPLLPARLLIILGIESRLRTLLYLESSTSGPRVMISSMGASYVGACHKLLGPLSSASSFPCFRLLVLSFPRPKSGDGGLRSGLLNAAIVASYKHRNSDGHGWRLGMKRPTGVDRFSHKDMCPWQCWCRVHGLTDSCFFLDTAEMHRFGELKNRTLKAGGQMEEYIAGSIHVDGTPAEWSSCSFRAGTPSGVMIRVGPEDSIELVRRAVESSVVAGVRCVCIDLSMLEVPDSQQHEGCEDALSEPAALLIQLRALRIDAPEDSFGYPIPLPELSFTFQLAAALGGPRLTQLTQLSLPASAFAAATTEHAKCGRHIGGYCAYWLKWCVALQTLHIKDWRACSGCNLLHSDTMEVVLSKRLPSSLRAVKVNGMFLLERSRRRWKFHIQQAWAIAFATRGFASPTPHNLPDAKCKRLSFEVIFARQVWFDAVHE